MSQTNQVDLEELSATSAEPKNADESRLPPTKVKRKYVCKKCDFTTINPREHLRHRRDAHGEKVRIVPCDLCQYACQFRQKLTRHLNLMHLKDPSKRASNCGKNGVSRQDSLSTAFNNHDEHIIDLCQYPADPRTLELLQQNDYNYQMWLQLQQLVATNQHQIANSFYYQNPQTVSEPLDLSVSK